MQTKIVSLSYNCMFKAVFGNNKYMLSRLTQSILDYLELDINVMNKELIIKNNELTINNAHNKQLICDYLIKVNKEMEINVEVNRSYYPGLEERNMTYCFKIYGDHFRRGDDYDKFKKYFLVQVNFNNFDNPDNDIIKEFYLLDVKNPKNYLTKNVCIINVAIAECFKLVYNEDKLKEMSSLEKFGAMLGTDILEDISYILESEGIDMKEKENFLEQVKEMSKDEDVLTNMKLEDNIDYRFNLVEEDALQRGRQQGIERGRQQGIEQTAKKMIMKNMDLQDIADITGKSIDEIKEIAKTLDKE